MLATQMTEIPPMTGARYRRSGWRSPTAPCPALDALSHLRCSEQTRDGNKPATSHHKLVPMHFSPPIITPIAKLQSLLLVFSQALSYTAYAVGLAEAPRGEENAAGGKPEWRSARPQAQSDRATGEDEDEEDAGRIVRPRSQGLRPSAALPCGTVSVRRSIDGVVRLV